MSEISSDLVSSGIQATNQVLRNAQAESLELAKKMVSVSADLKLNREAGKGDMVDIFA